MPQETIESNLVAMEPPGEPPDRDSSHSNQSLTNYSGKISVGDHTITEKLSRPMAFDKVCTLSSQKKFGKGIKTNYFKLCLNTDGAFSY